MEGTANYLNPDGTLRTARFAMPVAVEGIEVLDVSRSERAVRMHASDATAQPLLREGTFGADVLRFPAGGCVPPHTHPGDHLLFVLAGTGRVMHLGAEYPLSAGVCYLMPGRDVHAIYADTDLVLLSVANDHRPAGSAARLTLADTCPK